MELYAGSVWLLVFCRIGCCFMVLPGLSSVRVPQMARLLLALAFSLSVAPLVTNASTMSVDASGSRQEVSWIIRECMMGFAIGLLARSVFASVQIAFNLISQVSGFSQAFSSDDGHGEPTSELSALMSSGVIVLFFATDLHHMAIASLIDSYRTVGIGSEIDIGPGIDVLVRATSGAIRSAVGIAAPFLVASLIVNFGFGMLNRIAPQIPVFFVSSVFAIGVTLWFAASLAPELLFAAFQFAVIAPARL